MNQKNVLFCRSRKKIKCVQHFFYLNNDRKRDFSRKEAELKNLEDPRRNSKVCFIALSRIIYIAYSKDVSLEM